MKVSFNSKVDEGLRIQQLSGGQKSLVALATGKFLYCGCSHLCSPLLQCSLSRNVTPRPSTSSTRCAFPSASFHPPLTPSSYLQIDANLDAQYRTAVACRYTHFHIPVSCSLAPVAMIQELSSTAQFIVTTFRPEMLVTADKFYGVLFNNQKVSSIRSIKREEAQEFVDQEAQAQ